MMYIGQSGRQYVPSSSQFIDGGMGEIHFVVDPMKRDVRYALKLCKTDSPAFLQRFEREIFIHQHLCGLRVGFDGVIPFVESLSAKMSKSGFVMDYIEYGESLFVWARKRLLGLSHKAQRSFLLELLLRLFRLLEKIHEKGVLHNDIKPENILVAGIGTSGAEYQIYILDFGLARKIDEQLMVTTIGTLGYSAPELLGRANQADQSSDIFALCFVWLEIVRGQKNFEESEYPEHSAVQLEQLWKEEITRSEVIEGPFIGANLAVLLSAAIQPQEKRKYKTTRIFLQHLEYCIQILDRQIVDLEQLSFGGNSLYLGWAERIGERIKIPVQIQLKNPPQFLTQQGKIICPHYAQVSTEIHWAGIRKSKHVFTPSTKIAWAIRKNGSYADIYPASEDYPAARLWYHPERVSVTFTFQIRMRDHQPYLTSYQVYPENKNGQFSVYLFDRPNIWEVLSIQGEAFSPLPLQYKNELFICWDEEREQIIDIFQHRDFQMYSVIRELQIELPQLQTELQKRAYGEKVIPSKFPFTEKTKDNFLSFLQEIELRYSNLQGLIQGSMMIGGKHWNYPMWEIYGVLIHCYHQEIFQDFKAADWIRLAKNCFHHQVSKQRYWLIPFLLPQKPTVTPMISAQQIELSEQHSTLGVELLELADSDRVLETIQRESRKAICYFRYQLQDIQHMLALYSDDVFSIGRWKLTEKNHFPLFLSQMMPQNLLQISLEDQSIDVAEGFQSFVQYRRAHQKMQIIDAGFCRICPRCSVVYSDGFRDCSLHGTQKIATQYQGQYHTHNFHVQFHHHPVFHNNMCFSQQSSRFQWSYSIASKWSYLPNDVIVFCTEKSEVYVKASDEPIFLIAGTRKKKIEPNQVSIWKNEQLLIPSFELIISKYSE